MARLTGRRPLAERWVRKIYYKYYARNLFFELQRRARDASVDYIEENMADAMMFPDRWELLDHCIENADRAGLYAEFGVAQGKSISKLAGIVPSVIHGFDSFAGLPEDWSGTEARRGKFTNKGQLPQVPGNVVLHAGLFGDTIPPFKAKNPGTIAFLHMDCDIYASTRCVLEELADRFEAGTIIVFDEYFNYPNWRQHEFKAWQEFVQAFNVTYSYIGFSMKEGQVAVRIDSIEGR